MAKSSGGGGGGGGKPRRPQQHNRPPREQHRERPPQRDRNIERDIDRELDRAPAMDMEEDGPPVAAATAVDPAPPPALVKPEQSQGGTGEDVADFDQETNAKYEQVKGGQLYIRDL